MFKNLEVFRMSHAMAVHAGTHQAAVAQNIANADTPGYQAREVASFRDVYQPAGNSASNLRATRVGHLGGQQPHGPFEIQLRQSGPSSPNNNNVSLEMEMVAAVNVKRQHDRAITIYKSALNVLRTSLGRI